MRPRSSRLAEITLEKVEAERTQLEVASWTLEAAEKATERQSMGRSVRNWLCRDPRSDLHPEIGHKQTNSVAAAKSCSRVRKTALLKQRVIV